MGHTPAGPSETHQLRAQYHCRATSKYHPDHGPVQDTVRPCVSQFKHDEASPDPTAPCIACSPVWHMKRAHETRSSCHCLAPQESACSPATAVTQPQTALGKPKPSTPSLGHLHGQPWSRPQDSLWQKLETSIQFCTPKPVAGAGGSGVGGKGVTLIFMGFGGLCSIPRFTPSILNTHKSGGDTTPFQHSP